MIMRIGIDIDDTLLDTSKSFEKIIKKYNVNFSKKFNEFWTEKEKEYIYKNYLFEILVTALPKKDSISVIKKLKEYGHELYIITARGNKSCKNIEQETINIINNIYGIDKFYFGYYKKADIADNLNIDLMIDDNFDVYNDMCLKGIKCILFGDKISNWNEILKFIESGD